MTSLDCITLYLKKYFDSHQPKPLKPGERSRIETVKSLVVANFEKAKRPARYVLGLAVDFLLLAQELAGVDPELIAFRKGFSEDILFDRYALVTERAGQKSNTLSLTFAGRSIGIRKFEESVTSFFHAQNRTEYPSAYVYNTGQWTKYKELLVACFSLSTNGRYIASYELLEYGLSKLKENEFFGRSSERVRLFELIIREYARSHGNENGGLVFQAIANGYFMADRPHLCIISDKVRTGSARQKRIGDIDCYRGLDLECSVEVKDIEIHATNIEHQLRAFSNNVRELQVLGIVFVQSVADVVSLPTDITDGLVFLSLDDVLYTVRTWDWAKQEIAVQGMLHYLSHIEQSREATNRLLTFIAHHVTDHPALEYLQSS